MKKKVMLCVMCLFMLAGTVQAAGFTDMNKKKSSLYVEVEYLAERGIIEGYPDGRFKPNSLIEKKHIASMLVRALELPMTNLKNPGYKDVPKSHPYYQEIAAAYTAGLFSKADYFKPDSHISRAFMARLISKAFKLQVHGGVSEADEYLDVPRSSEFYQDIRIVSSNNIASGYPDGTFKPKQLITRAHFAAFLTRSLTKRAMNILPDKKYVYYYTDGKSKYRHVYEGKNDFELDQWRVTNETKAESIPRHVYLQDAHSYGEGYDDWFHFDQYIPHPFVVTRIHSEGDIGPVSYGNVSIIDTNAVRIVNNVEYRDVLVLETSASWNKDTIYEYYAKDIGLIQVIDGKGKELMSLVERQ